MTGYKTILLLVAVYQLLLDVKASSTFMEKRRTPFAHVRKTRDTELVEIDISPDTGYNSWGSWTKCSTTCDIGRSIRRRSCDNPIHCEDGNFEVKLCLHKRCHKRKHGGHNN